MDQTASDQNKVETLEKELRRVRKENEALRFMLEITSQKCKILEFQHIDNNNNIDHMFSNKRARIYEHHQIPIVANKTSTQVFVRTDLKDKNLNVKDGYQWRKYGQKVTKNNSFPRAYFRCSMAPLCTVKKKVQRSREDETILVAIYDGQHNHDACGQFNHTIISSSSERRRNDQDQDRDLDRDHDQTRSAASTSTIAMSQPPVITLDLSLSGLLNNNINSNNNKYDDNDNQMRINRLSEVDNDSLADDELKCVKYEGKSIDKSNYVEECVSSLTKDRTFALALDEAVARSMSNVVHPQCY